MPTLPDPASRCGRPTTESERLRDAARRGRSTDDDEHAEALALLRAHPAMDEARAYVQAEADAARALLDKLPEGPARDALDDICDTVATRLG